MSTKISRRDTRRLIWVDTDCSGLSVQILKYRGIILPQASVRINMLTSSMKINICATDLTVKHRAYYLLFMILLGSRSVPTEHLKMNFFTVFPLDIRPESTEQSGYPS